MRVNLREPAWLRHLKMYGLTALTMFNAGYVLIASQGTPNLSPMLIIVTLLAFSYAVMDAKGVNLLAWVPGDEEAFLWTLATQGGTTLIFGSLAAPGAMSVIARQSSVSQLLRNSAVDVYLGFAATQLQTQMEEVLITAGLTTLLVLILGEENKLYAWLITAGVFSIYHGPAYLGVSPLQALSKIGEDPRWWMMCSTFITQIVKCWQFDKVRSENGIGGLAGISLAHFVGNVMWM